MAVKITHIAPKISPTPSDFVVAHSTIKKFMWIDEEDSEVGTTSIEGMFDWIVNKKGQAYIRKGQNNKILVFGTISPSGKKYLRCLENGRWTNDLLDLPEIEE